MATEKAPVELTGGAGHEFEDDVAARFLVDLLAGRCSLGDGTEKVVKIAWQDRGARWLADDLVLTCARGADEREVGLSIKSNKQVTRTGFPDDFTELAWEQRRGGAKARALLGTNNELGLIVGELAADVEAGWNSLVRQLRESRSDLGRIAARLVPPSADDPGAQSSEIQRALAKSFERPPGVAPATRDPDLEYLELLSQIHLLQLDFRSASSRQEKLAFADCCALLASGDETEAQRLWIFLRELAGRKRAAGGTIVLPELLTELRDHFTLLPHPDFQADWRNIDRHSLDAMALVSNEIFRLGSLARVEESAEILQHVRDNNVSVIVGQSGAGKSALAKTTADRLGVRVCWLTVDSLDAATVAQFESGLGLAHPLEAVLAAAPGGALVVLDAFETSSSRGRQIVEHLLRQVAKQQPQNVSVLVTVQPDGLDRLTAVLVKSSFVSGSVRVVLVEAPRQSEIDALLSKEPRIPATLNASLRPVLRNLKVSDWVARGIHAGSVLDTSKVVNFSSLIEWIWNGPWIGGADNSDARSALLMNLAVRESESLSAGIARTALASGEQEIVGGLEHDGALVRRHERLFFQHDLLGDWSRLHVLMSEHPVSLAMLRTRVENPRWHGAIRLYAVWLLELAPSGLSEWQSLVQDATQADDTPLLALLLEAIFVASEPGNLIQLLWPSFVAEEGALLGSLLDRFLYTCTIPDRRLMQFGVTPELMAHMEHSFRLPGGPQWGSLLKELRAHAADVARLAPIAASRIADLWLKVTPVEQGTGASFPWRIEAAELAFAVAREFQMRSASDGVHWGEASKIVFEALLRAAPDLSAKGTELCLQLAERRDADAELVAHRARVAQEKEQRWRQQDSLNPELAARRAKLLHSPIERGPLREPWPDGPRLRVSEAFRSACLNSDAFLAFVSAAPDAALEVLLAVCIEEPRHDDPYNASHGDIGLTYWREGYPALYLRGPFLQFLRAAPEKAVTFVVRLLNFASLRQANYAAVAYERQGFEVESEDIHVVVNVEGTPRRWRGGATIFEWHYWSACGPMIVCVLQALEYWLYEQLENQADVVRWLARLMGESESLALAGLLVDVGKRHPNLLEGPLRPLLAAAPLYALDSKAAFRRALENSSEMIGWNGQHEALFNLARDWYSAAHRKTQLVDVAVNMLFQREDLRIFFLGARTQWLEEAGAVPADSPVRLLSERLTFENYRFYRDEGGNTLVQLQWPEDVQRAIDAKQAAIEAETRLIGLPMQCRSTLRAAVPLPEPKLDELWLAINDVERATREDDGREESMFNPTDAICAGIAVILTLHSDWLSATPERLNWCRAQLELTLDAATNPAALGFDSAPGDLQWDCFAAESGIFLLQTDPKDALARKLVAAAVTANRYAATELVMRSAFRARERLGDDFGRMQVLAALWSALRRRRDDLAYVGDDTTQSDAERVELIESFVVRELSIERPTLLELSKSNRARMLSKDSSEATEPTEAPGVASLDLRVVQAAFAWLDLSAATSASELAAWRSLLLDLLEFALAGVEPDEQHVRRSFGTPRPHEFDYWVLQLVAWNLYGVKNVEHEREIWRRVLALGRVGHRWIECFCRTWTSFGAAQPAAHAWFIAVWSEMIRFAGEHQGWASPYVTDHDLSRAVIELLGFGHSGRHLFADEARGPRLAAAMLPSLEAGAARWFNHSPVATAFASFATALGAGSLLIPGIRWLSEAISHEAVREDEQLDEHLIEFLRTCWRVEQSRIQRDPALTAMFRALLAHANMRGSHAAASLRDQILGSISSAQATHS